MKITNADIIKNGEQDLIDAITADLDWGAIENIFREQHNLGIDEDVEYKQGDIVVHGGLKIGAESCTTGLDTTGSNYSITADSLTVGNTASGYPSGLCT